MPWRILLVTDDSAMAELAPVRSRHGYRTRLAPDAWEGLRLIIRAGTCPALVIIDAAASRLNDFFAARAAISDLAVVPVILLTSDDAAPGWPDVTAYRKPAPVPQILQRIAHACHGRAETSRSRLNPAARDPDALISDQG